MAKPHTPTQEKAQVKPQAVEKAEDKDFRYLVRIAGLDINGKKRVVFGLSMLNGIGPRTAKTICDLTNIGTDRRIGELTEEEVEKIEEAIKTLPKNTLPWMLNRRKVFETGQNVHLIGSDLLIAEREDIARMKRIRSYKGIRHELGLPVRGQRTKTWGRGKTVVGVSRVKAAQVAAEKKKAEAAEKAEAKPEAKPAAAAKPEVKK